MKFAKSILYFIAVLALAMFLITIGSVNGQQIHVNYLIAQGDFSLPVLLVGAFFAGFIVSIGALGFNYLVARFKIRRLQNQLSRLTQTSASSPATEE